MARHARTRGLACAVGAVLLVFSLCASASAPPKVVLLTGGDAMQADVVIQTQAIQHELNSELAGGTVTSLDTLDSHRLGDAYLETELLALLQKKYKDEPIDLVVAIGNYAAEFVSEHHASIWPNTPILVSGVPQAWIRKDKALPPMFVLMPYRMDVEKTLAMAQALQPTARQLVVVGGNAEPDIQLADAIAGAANEQRKQWTSVERWEGLTIPELRHRLSRLDKHRTVVLYGSQYRDHDGHQYLPFELIAHITADSPVPIYGAYSNDILQGAAAGAVHDLEDNGRATGRMAARMLNHRMTVVESTIEPPLPTRCMANIEVLRRFGISETSLGPDCTWINTPLPLYREYWKEIVVVLFVLGAQGFTLATMLIQRRKRRSAEREAATRRADLARAARIATVGELSASIAHEIGQPLGAILSNVDAADLMMRRPEDGAAELREILTDVRRDALRANDVIVRLRALLQKQAITFTPIELDATLERAMSLVRPEARRRGIVVDAKFDSQGAWVLADQVQLQQVLLNLSINGMDAMENEEHGDRVLSITTQATAGGVELIVGDRGIGIADENLEQLFEAFYTTKARGTGLGLSIVRSIAEAHRGTITARPRAGKGTEFILWLPEAAPDVLRTADATSTSASATPHA